MEAVLELKHVDKIYGCGDAECKALDNANLKIHKGEKVGIMGASGSGKSTLLNMIGLLDRPTRGEVLIENKHVQKYNDNQLAKIRRDKIGFVFQSFNLVPTLTTVKNVSLPMIFSDRGSEKKAAELLTLVGLAKKIENYPNQLSGGEKQRVAIARALANDPEIILADEPTGNLDSKSGKEIIDLLLKLNKEKGITLIIVTHEKFLASKMKRIVEIKDGKIIRDQRRNIA